MKKIFATLLAASLMFAATDAFAQLSAGLGYINTTEKSVYTPDNGDPVTSTRPLNGFYVGADYNIPVPAVSGLSVEPGLYASMLFGKQDVEELKVLTLVIYPGGTYKYSDIALNVPIKAKYSIDLSGDTKVFVFAGPTFSYALSNKTQYATTGSSDYSTTDNLKGNSASRNPFNIYLGGGLGFQVSQILINVGYDFSLLNYSTADKTNLSRPLLRIGVSYAL
jgi:hypothetical protein